MTTPPEDLGATFPVLVSVRDGKFCLRINELALVVRDRDIQRAYDELKRRRRELIDYARAADAIDELPIPKTIALTPRPLAPRDTGGS